MNPRRTEEIERKLTEGGSPHPPEGLLDRLKQDIPQGLSYQNIERIRPAAAGWRSSWAVAASILAVVAMSYVMLRVAQMSRLSDLSPMAAEGVADVPAMSLPIEPQQKQRAASPQEAVSRPATAPPTIVDGFGNAEPMPELQYGRAGSKEGPAKASMLKKDQPRDQRTSEAGFAGGKREGEDAANEFAEEAKLAVRSRVDSSADSVEDNAVGGLVGGVISQIDPDATVSVAERQNTASERVTVSAAAPSVQGAPAPPAAPSRRMERDKNPADEAPFSGSYGGGELVDAEADPVSSFGLRVATGSYVHVKRALEAGTLPAPAAVRVEELVNHFDRDGRAPVTGDFAISTEGAPVPLSDENDRMLLRIAVRARSTSKAGENVVASAAKASVEFDPDVVAAYRLIGYDDRSEASAGRTNGTEIPVGHTVVALYEIKLHQPLEQKDRIATVSLHYKKTSGRGKESTIAHDVRSADFTEKWDSASSDLKLASLVAKWGEVLKNSSWARSIDPAVLLQKARLLSSQYANNRAMTEFVSLTATTARLMKGN